MTDNPEEVPVDPAPVADGGSTSLTSATGGGVSGVPLSVADVQRIAVTVASILKPATPVEPREKSSSSSTGTSSSDCTIGLVLVHVLCSFSLSHSLVQACYVFGGGGG